MTIESKIINWPKGKLDFSAGCLVMGMLYLACLPCFLYLVRPFLKQRGLETEQLKSLPSIEYQKLPLAESTDTLACTVCLEDYKSTDQVIQLPCQHVFHQTCLVEWLKINGICPMCRASVIPTLNPV